MTISATELAALVRTDPQVQQALRRLMAGFTSDLAEGRVPGEGSGQNDTFPFAENVDATHPGRLYYVLPTNSQRVVSAKLSFWPLTYRTYNTFSASTTGAETGHSHSHNHSSAAHSHSHSHTPTGSLANSTGSAVTWDGIAGVLATSGGGDFSNSLAIGNDATSTTPGSTGTNAAGSSGHTHPISGSSFLGITEGIAAAGITILFDGVDRTVALGGPWSADVIEMDVTKYVQDVSRGAKHLISLTSTGLGQIQGHLRLSFYSNSAQGG